MIEYIEKLQTRRVVEVLVERRLVPWRGVLKIGVQVLRMLLAFCEYGPDRKGCGMAGLLNCYIDGASLHLNIEV